MRTTPFALLAAVILVLSFACGESAPPPEPAAEPEAANPNEQFAGAWALVRSERRDADGELLESRVKTGSATSCTTRPGTWA